MISLDFERDTEIDFKSLYSEPAQLRVKADVVPEERIASFCESCIKFNPITNRCMIPEVTREAQALFSKVGCVVAGWEWAVDDAGDPDPNIVGLMTPLGYKVMPLKEGVNLKPVSPDGFCIKSF